MTAADLPVVSIRPRRANPSGESTTAQTPACVYELVPPAVVDAGELVLAAEMEWLVQGPADVLDEVHRLMPAIAEPIGDVLLLSFGNSVGHFDLGRLGRWRTVSGKWQPADFDGMLSDLMDVASALPFSAGQSASLPYDRSVVARHDVLYHAFVYLRHVALVADGSADDLIASLRTILREPHQRFERVSRRVPVELADRVQFAGLSRIAAGIEPLIAVSPSLARLPLARVLGDRLPERVEETHVRPTHDTAENRFVRAFLNQAGGIVEGMRRVVRGEPVSELFRANVDRDCAAIDRALQPIRRHTLWSEVGDMTHLPAGSTVLQRRRGYKDVLRHFARLRLAARVPLTLDTVRDLLEVRDIALMYELWCYFAVAREIEFLLGSPTLAAGPDVTKTGLSVARDLTIRWGNAAALYYNRGFSYSQSADRRSYSLPLRPDIALEVAPSGRERQLHLFDAKFKLDKLDSLLSSKDDDADLDEDDAGERRGTFKRADLYKMHTYRDAIKNARSVWILYPGTEARFFGHDGTRWHGDAIVPPADGVGALPLQPGKRAYPELRQVLVSLLAIEAAAA